MRVLFLVALFAVTTPSFGQDCHIRFEIDPYTKLEKLSTGFLKLDGGSVTIDADAKEIDVLFTVEGADKCFDNNSTAYIFFEGVKTKLTARNGGTMNCEGLFHFVFKNTASTPTILKKLITQPINHIVFTGNNKKESTVNISAADQALLMAMANCLVEDARKLIK